MTFLCSTTSFLLIINMLDRLTPNRPPCLFPYCVTIRATLGTQTKWEKVVLSRPNIKVSLIIEGCELGVSLVLLERDCQLIICVNSLRSIEYMAVLDVTIIV